MPRPQDSSDNIKKNREEDAAKEGKRSPEDQAKKDDNKESGKKIMGTDKD